MKKTLLFSLIALGASALAANDNAVDMAQPQPPATVKTTTTVTTERTVGNQTTTETAQPVTQVEAAPASDKLPPPQRFDNADAAQTRQYLRDNFHALQKADTLEAMAEPLRLFSAYADQAQLLGIGNVDNAAQQAYVDELAQLRQGIVELQSKAELGDLAGDRGDLGGTVVVGGAHERKQPGTGDLPDGHRPILAIHMDSSAVDPLKNSAHQRRQPPRP